MASAERIVQNIRRLRDKHVAKSTKDLPIRTRVFLAAGRSPNVMQVNMDRYFCGQCGVGTPWPCRVIETLDALEETTTKPVD